MQHCDSLTVLQRRSLVSRRNTAKLRLRQKYEREFQTLISIDLNAIQQQVSQSSASQPIRRYLLFSNMQKMLISMFYCSFYNARRQFTPTKHSLCL